jgi:hypothetical protein
MQGQGSGFLGGLLLLPDRFVSRGAQRDPGAVSSPLMMIGDPN